MTPSLTTVLSRHDTAARAVAIAVVAVLCAAAWWSATYNLDLRIAIGGFSPLHYIGKITCPECFVGDSDLGDMFGVSLLSLVYEAAYAVGIDPLTTQFAVIGAEVVATAAVFYWAVRAVFHGSVGLGLFVVAIVMTSSALHLNMGGWRMPYFSGLPYALPEALRLAGVLLFVLDAPVLSGIVLAIAFAAHPAIGGLGIVFVVGMVLARPSLLLRPRVAAGGLVSGGLILAWMALRYTDGSLTAPSGAVSDEEWSAINRMLNFHFYPDEQGLLTTRADAIFLPWLSATLLLFHYMSRLRPLADKDRLMAGGFVMAFAICVFGIVVAAFDVSPSLVRLTLIRASDLIAQFGIFYIAIGLYRDITDGRLIRGVLASLVVVSIFSFPRYPLVPVLLLSIGGMIQQWRRREIDLNLVISSVLATGIVGLAAYYAFAEVLQRPMSWILLGTRPYVREDWWMLAGSAGLGLALIAFLAVRLRGERAAELLSPKALVPSASAFGALFLTAALAVMGGHQIWETRSFARPQAMLDWAADYREAQLWARDNTPPGTLFMPDPTIYYGWRDFSWRPSFGNMFEWLRQPVLYRIDETAFLEGRRRFAEFGLDLEKYKAMGPEMKGYIALDKDLKARFYSLDDEWFARMARKYGVQYAVLDKSLQNGTLGFPTTFENRGFVVYEIGPP